jgi:hypothetical protein
LKRKPFKKGDWFAVPVSDAYDLGRTTTSNEYQDCSIASGVTYYYVIVPVFNGIEGVPSSVPTRVKKWRRANSKRLLTVFEV